jgi:putative ABC transport system permease protein
LPQASGLHPLVDANLRPVRPPRTGIVLARKLAESLGVTAGDSLTVKVLEGRRPVGSVRVEGLVDELTGLGAYMNRHALARLLGEDDAISGAWLAVDPNGSAALYRTLKRLPAVGGISIREAALASFRDILDKSIRVTTLVNIVFACIIAFGIIYNSARISLSERGNELASLRVLGFTNQEVTVILLGEQAVLTLLAIPFGLILGYWICAFLSERLSTDLYRLPLVINPSSFAFDVAVVLIAATLSGLLVARRIKTMDLIAVLKTRE